MQIHLVGWQQLNRVRFWGEEGSKGRDRRRANSGDREERERKEHVRRRRRDVGCSHRQAHSSCNACWDALGSVLHNTITACSGVLCSAPLCSDCVLLSFVRFPLFQRVLVSPPCTSLLCRLHDSPFFLFCSAVTYFCLLVAQAITK